MDPHHHPPPSSPHRLARYRSAPGSLLASIADSVLSDSLPPPLTITNNVNNNTLFTEPPPPPTNGITRFITGVSPCLTQDSVGYGDFNDNDFDEERSVGGTGGGLIRHSSSPAGFFSHLLVDDGLPIPSEIGHYSLATNGNHAMGNRRLKSQLSFSRQDSLSQISETNILDMGENMWGSNSGETGGNTKRSYMQSDHFPVGSWDDTSSIMSSGPANKRARESNRDIATSLSGIETQYSLPTTSLEMSSMEKFLQIQQDSGPFKIRAKRGCATHPRSIAERDRRTRISEKLRKLQELVPNMDKQTCTSDMLDFAVQHIKELQSQVQVLDQEKASCTCGNKKENQ